MAIPGARSGELLENPSSEPGIESPAARLPSESTAQFPLQDPALVQNRPSLRHLGTTQIRPRTGDRLNETISDYLDLFHDFQIDPMYHASFWTDIIYRYRQGTRHLPLLRRGTDASIKNMSDDVLRAYGQRIWSQASEWRSDLAEGEEMLLYDKTGSNTRLYEIFATLWWRMRDIVFEPKPAPRTRYRSAREIRQAGGTLEAGTASEGEDAYQADTDGSTYFGTDSEAGPATLFFTKARAKANSKLEQLQNKLPAPAPAPVVCLSTDETEEEILTIIKRLADLREASHPDTFERLWNAHIERAYEVEDALLEEQRIMEARDYIGESGPTAVVEAETSDKQVDHDIPMEDADVTSKAKSDNTNVPRILHDQTTVAIPSAAAPLAIPTNLGFDAEARAQLYPNLSSEPFHASGNPIAPSLSQMHRLSPTLPGYMSIYIMTSPSHFAYQDRAYHHPSAPVAIQNQVAFFQQVMERAERIADHEVLGYAFSYGWCDVSRWIEKTVGCGCRGSGDGREAGESEGERLGWEVFQKDVLAAAKMGVRVWRMKVLVVKR